MGCGLVLLPLSVRIQRNLQGVGGLFLQPIPGLAPLAQSLAKSRFFLHALPTLAPFNSGVKDFFYWRNPALGLIGASLDINRPTSGENVEPSVPGQSLPRNEPRVLENP